jgi:putative nucleotidyltransferase with HDIG domain
MADNFSASSSISSIVRWTTLPSPSPIVERILDLIYTPDSDINDLISVIQSDVVLTGKILRFANSVFSSPAAKIDNLKDAVTRIGMVQTVQIVSATEIAGMFFSVPLPYGDICKLWAHNLFVACLSNSYADTHGLNNPGRWFFAGLLHDIGRLVLICHDPVKYGEAITHAKRNGIDLRAAEEAVVGYSHMEIGCELLTFWKLPEDFAAAAAGHHAPFVSVEDYPSGVGVCNTIANEILFSDSPDMGAYAARGLDKMISDSVEMYNEFSEVCGMAKMEPLPVDDG